MRTAKTDQTGQMHRLIWVFAWHKGHFVGFDMRRLSFVDLMLFCTIYELAFIPDQFWTKGLSEHYLHVFLANWEGLFVIHILVLQSIRTTRSGGEKGKIFLTNMLSNGCFIVPMKCHMFWFNIVCSEGRCSISHVWCCNSNSWKHKIWCKHMQICVCFAPSLIGCFDVYIKIVTYKQELKLAKYPGNKIRG